MADFGAADMVSIYEIREVLEGLAAERAEASLVEELILAPLVLAGARLGRRSHHLLERGWLRPAVLAFSALSSMAVIADSLVR